MVLHKHVYGKDTKFTTMSVPLEKKYLEKWLGVTRRGSYQAAAKESRWACEPASDFWRDIEPVKDSSVNWSSDEGRKDQENLDDKEH